MKNRKKFADTQIYVPKAFICRETWNCTLMFVMLKNPDKILVQLVMIILFLGILVSKLLLYIKTHYTVPNS